MRQKKLSLLFLFTIIMIVSLSPLKTNAFTTHTVEYPTHVKLGESFTVNIEFNYPLEEDCLYGIYVWFHSMVNNEITSSWTSGLQTYIYNLENYPRPTNVSWTFDTLIFAYSSLETDDIIKFKIIYKTGYDDGCTVTFKAKVITSHYEIIIGEETTNETNGTNTIVFVPIITMFIALIASRIILPKKEKLKKEELK